MLNKCKEPVLFGGGDFNIIRSSDEKNKCGVHKHTNLFNSIINTFGLIDIHMTGGNTPGLATKKTLLWKD
jgi:hypothetical protein